MEDRLEVRREGFPTPSTLTSEAPSHVLNQPMNSSPKPVISINLPPKLGLSAPLSGNMALSKSVSASEPSSGEESARPSWKEAYSKIRPMYTKSRIRVAPKSAVQHIMHILGLFNVDVKNSIYKDGSDVPISARINILTALMTNAEGVPRFWECVILPQNEEGMLAIRKWFSSSSRRFRDSSRKAALLVTRTPEQDEEIMYLVLQFFARIPWTAEVFSKYSYLGTGIQKIYENGDFRNPKIAPLALELYGRFWKLQGSGDPPPLVRRPISNSTQPLPQSQPASDASSDRPSRELVASDGASSTLPDGEQKPFGLTPLKRSQPGSPPLSAAANPGPRPLSEDSKKPRLDLPIFTQTPNGSVREIISSVPPTKDEKAKLDLPILKRTRADSPASSANPSSVSAPQPDKGDKQTLGPSISDHLTVESQLNAGLSLSHTADGGKDEADAPALKRARVEPELDNKHEASPQITQATAQVLPKSTVKDPLDQIKEKMSKSVFDSKGVMKPKTTEPSTTVAVRGVVSVEAEKEGTKKPQKKQKKVHWPKFESDLVSVCLVESWKSELHNELVETVLDAYGNEIEGRYLKIKYGDMDADIAWYTPLRLKLAADTVQYKIDVVEKSGRQSVDHERNLHDDGEQPTKSFFDTAPDSPYESQELVEEVRSSIREVDRLKKMYPNWWSFYYKQKMDLPPEYQPPRHVMISSDPREVKWYRDRALEITRIRLRDPVAYETILRQRKEDMVEKERRRASPRESPSANLNEPTPVRSGSPVSINPKPPSRNLPANSFKPSPHYLVSTDSTRRPRSAPSENNTFVPSKNAWRKSKKRCAYFVTGRCMHGDKCSFLHIRLNSDRDVRDR